MKKIKKDPVVVLSTSIHKSAKDLLERFCKQHGVKINYFIEEAILEQIENAMDVELIEARANEERVPWKKSA